MNKKQIIAAVSSSALASGMAHGAVLYSGPVNVNLPCTATPPSTAAFDMNGDGIGDFLVGFDGDSSPANSQKPYIQGYPFNTPGSTVLAGTNQNNLPVTPFGTLINGDYLDPTTNSTGQAYFDQEFDDQSAHYVGSWQTSLDTEGYVGMELWDGSGNTNFGWVHIIYDSAITPNTLAVVDYAYETTPFAGIIAGATNEVGAPDIYSEPQSQSVALGASVQFSVVMLAAPPPTYQWELGPTNGQGPYAPLSDGGVISGSTNATLTINGATTDGDYRVMISNALGVVTSAPATLIVSPPRAAPTPQILFSGLTAYFNVSVAASLSPVYQWQKNGVNLSDGGRIAGSQTSRLQISNLQVADTETYDVVVTFGSTPVTSTVASLTVLPASQESIYDAAVLAAGPVVYYRLNETGNPAATNLIAYDNAGGFNGIYGIDVTNGYDGIAGPDPANGFPGFASNNTAVLITPNDTNAWITLAPWNLNTNSVTFTAWVNPVAEPNSQAGVVYTGTTNDTDAGICYYYEDTGNGMQLSYAWNEGPGNDECEFFQSGLYTPANEWSFLAVAVTSSNATLYVFNAEGTNSATDESYLPNPSFDPNGSTNQVMPFNNPEYIGTEPSSATSFNGAIGAVAVFSQTLTSNQLQTLYNAALGALPPVTLGITSVGPNVQITWARGSLLQATSLNGPWVTNTLAASPYIVAPSGSMFYRAVAP
ncbi:MAG: LamG-like jellyroll fold domain-containing protein [Limisphaerales bacterium]